MSAPAPSSPGSHISEIETPALLVDLTQLEQNIQSMAAFCARHDILLRPHGKTHKSLDIAELQIQGGAVGVCCQKVGEAEVFAGGGIADILVTNQIVGRTKIDRLAALAATARIGVCVDHPGNIRELSRAAVQRNVTLDILVEFDVGSGRCGVKSTGEVLHCARLVHDAPNLSFAGLQAYYGSAQHIREWARRREAAGRGHQKLSAVLQELAELGLPCRTVSGGGTGTYQFDAESGLYTELQCGSYVFMDVDYARLLDDSGTPLEVFGSSLSVLATIMSKTEPGRAICDAGLKAHSVDSGLPQVRGPHRLRYSASSDEHGVIEDEQDVLAVGDRIMLVPGHCDPTVNLYDWYVGIRDNRVETVWPVQARGMVS